MVAEAGTIILQLFVIYVSAKVLGGLGQLVKIPAVVGEILAGVVIANTLLGTRLGLGDATHLEFLEVLSELGVIFLIFTVGLETPFEEMKRVGGVSLIVAVMGVVLPFGAGWGLMVLLGYNTIESLFVGAALVATSVGITARVLAELGVLGREEARIILGAAVIDDVLGLTVLTVVSGISQGPLQATQIGILIVQALAFVAILMYFGGRVLKRVIHPERNPLSERWEWTSPKGSLFPLAIIVCLGLSALAASIGLAAIIGAFLAGMAFAATESRHDLVERFEGVVQFTVPFFFAFIGLQVDLAEASRVVWLTLAVTGLAIVTKVVGCGVGALGKGVPSATAIGIGMMPRGEVGIIVALVGLASGAVSQGIYSVVVAMSLLTTLLAPPLLVWSFKRLPPEHPSGGAPGPARAQG